jgi:hypothetical protein
MIDFGKILKRAWHILWNYKVLWIFGILLAITAGSVSSGSGSGYQFSGNTPRPSNHPGIYQPGEAWQEFNAWFEQDVLPVFERPDEHITTFIWIGVILLVIIILFSVLFAFVRYVSETAVLRMVDGYEQDGSRLGFKAGWKLGWDKRAFRLWVIDLIVNLPAMLVGLVLLVLGILFFVSVVNGTARMAVASAITAIGCSFIFLMLLSLVMVFLRLLRQFIGRAAALEGTRVGDSFRRGWAMFKRNWKSAAVMWLIMLGIGIGYGIAGMIAFFLLIPVYVVLLIPALLVAAIPGLIAFGIASLFTGNILAGIIGGLVALPFFFTILFAPLTLLGGWYMLYESNVWTLTYREMKALESLEPGTEAEAGTSAEPPVKVEA